MRTKYCGHAHCDEYQNDWRIDDGRRTEPQEPGMNAFLIRTPYPNHESSHASMAIPVHRFMCFSTSPKGRTGKLANGRKATIGTNDASES